MELSPVYLFRESGGTVSSNWFGLFYDGCIHLQNARETAKQLIQLRKEQRLIIDSRIDFASMIHDPNNWPGYKPKKYRNLKEGDRETLNAAEIQLIHEDRYPHITQKELQILDQLQQDGVDKGLLWVSDIDLYPKKELEMLVREMGTPFAPMTTYKLSTQLEYPAIGRIEIGQFVAVLTYYQKVMSLNNTTPHEAKRFSSIGRPLKDMELDILIQNGIKIV